MALPNLQSSSRLVYSAKERAKCYIEHSPRLMKFLHFLHFPTEGNATAFAMLKFTSDEGRQSLRIFQCSLAKQLPFEFRAMPERPSY